jgi:hypothetical protein
MPDGMDREATRAAKERSARQISSIRRSSKDPDGGSITSHRSAHRPLWAISAESRAVTRLLWFPDPERSPFRPMVDVDDSNFYTTIGSRESDVWVMQLVEKK